MLITARTSGAPTTATCSSDTALSMLPLLQMAVASLVLGYSTAMCRSVRSLWALGALCKARRSCGNEPEVEVDDPMGASLSCSIRAELGTARRLLLLVHSAAHTEATVASG